MNGNHTYRLMIIAATGSGVGKTSIASGLVFSLRHKGYRVQTFKVGPDFLDPSWLEIASGKPCHSLDSWMTSPDYIVKLVHRRMRNSDIGIIEGVMGLYDGVSPDNNDGSTAAIARLLKAPVLLIANAHGAARSFAASILGFINFPDAPVFNGIIANQTGSQRHIDIIFSALSSLNLPPLLGGIPKNSLPSLPGRHLGLISASTRNDSEEKIEEIAKLCDQNLNVNELISSLPLFTLYENSPDATYEMNTSKKAIRIAYAYDEAFHFYYLDNLNIFEQFGAELIAFSPLHDSNLPDDIDGLYIGGGYPEEYADKLSNNQSMLHSIAQFAASKNPIYAECGGLMYLSKSIKDRNSIIWPMVGALPFETEISSRLHTLGYCEVILKDDCIIGKKGSIYKGHEFHYSCITNENLISYDPIFQVMYRNNRKLDGGYVKKNIVASYIHLHWGETPQVAEHFIKSCRRSCCANI